MSNQHPLTSPLKMSALGNSMTTLDGTTRALLTESHADANRMTLSSASLSVLASSAQNALSVVHQNEALVEDMTSLTGRVSVLDQRLERVDARLRLRTFLNYKDILNCTFPVYHIHNYYLSILFYQSLYTCV